MPVSLKFPKERVPRPCCILFFAPRSPSSPRRIRLSRRGIAIASLGRAARVPKRTRKQQKLRRVRVGHVTNRNCRTTVPHSESQQIGQRVRSMCHFPPPSNLLGSHTNLTSVNPTHHRPGFGCRSLLSLSLSLSVRRSQGFCTFVHKGKRWIRYRLPFSGCGDKGGSRIKIVLFDHARRAMPSSVDGSATTIIIIVVDVGRPWRGSSPV